MTAYYNEHEPYAAQWLRNLIAAGHIAPGDVDERDIRDLKPQELKQYTQCHFFAGVGVWSLALRQAGWPDDKPVWTGSCPCQPFSAAGRKVGFTDERHLWPHWYHLITQCRPSHIFGEQVASKDGLGWLDLVQTDLEGAGYANAAVDLCAAGVGAPHIRQRLWFIAERLAKPDSPRLEKSISVEENSQDTGGTIQGETAIRGRTLGRLADTQGRRLSGRGRTRREDRQKTIHDSRLSGTGPTNGYWRDVDWLFCRDGKWRPVKSGTFPLVNGATNCVGKLRAYGNAINAEAAQAFIEAYLAN